MTIDYNQIDEYGDPIRHQDPVDVQPQYTQPTQVVQADTDAISEVESRLETAQYYRMLLSDSLFGDVANPAVAAQVETEIRGFVRERMSALVGIGAPATSSGLTPEEHSALQKLAQPDVLGALLAIAGKVTKRPSLVAVDPPPPPPPTLKKVSIAKSGVRKVSNAPPTPVAPPVAVASPAQSPAKQVAQVTRAVVQSVGDDGVVSSQTKQRRLVRQEIRASDGKAIEVDVTPQSRPVGPIQPIPFPSSKRELEAASERHAQRCESLGQRANDRVLSGGPALAGNDLGLSGVES